MRFWTLIEIFQSFQDENRDEAKMFIMHLGQQSNQKQSSLVCWSRQEMRRFWMMVNLTTGWTTDFQKGSFSQYSHLVMHSDIYIYCILYTYILYNTYSREIEISKHSLEAKCLQNDFASVSLLADSSVATNLAWIRTSPPQYLLHSTGDWTGFSSSTVKSPQR